MWHFFMPGPWGLKQCGVILHADVFPLLLPCFGTDQKRCYYMLLYFVVKSIYEKS